VANPFDEAQAARETTRDAALKDSFPASDPAPISPAPGTRKAEQEPVDEPAGNAEPMGTPSSDRHASETAHTPSEAPHEAHTKDR
jgi:hypothetical protein